MRDFTLKTYQTLIEALQQAGYKFQTFEEFMTMPTSDKSVVMRHDVDELAGNALEMAKLENKLGIKATYFFRIVKKSNVPEVINQIVKLEHEVGYHYEDLALAEGNVQKAIDSFKKNLDYFRCYYPVKSVCMHGSSTSKYDNRLIWEKCHLSDFGLVGEPYITTDFLKVYYLTDTGYAWDGGRFATRDIVDNTFGLSFHSTKEIVSCISTGNFPPNVMFLAHTLWTDNTIQWYGLHIREYLRNNIKMIAQKNTIINNLYGKIVKLYWKK